jgi:hypothetical protein
MIPGFPPKKVSGDWASRALRNGTSHGSLVLF